MIIRRGARADAPIDFAAIRAGLGIPTSYPAAAVAQAAAGPQDPPDTNRRDATSIPLVTIDPPGSLDLDQAMQLERIDGDDPHRVYRVHYAIADVAAFVPPGGPLDTETRRRGQTLYSPDARTPLHPPAMAEGTASLLPEQVRPAVLWTIELDDAGEPTSVRVQRATVRSVARLDYAGVQADVDAGHPHPSVALLLEIGGLRQAAARRRHAINLNLPDPEVTADGPGHWTLTRRSENPVERANAEISLLTGMCAAQIMLHGKVGVLRTLPPPDHGQVAALHRSAVALGIDWPDGTEPGDVVSGLDSGDPHHAAFLEDAIRLLRGAGYTPFDGSLPAQTGHGGVGAPYAHVTAPLRRLVDRFGTEVCLALHAGKPVPDWVLTALPDLPEIMSASDRLADELDRECAAAVVAFLLRGREGQLFDGVVVQNEPRHDGQPRATVLLDDPPVATHCPGDGLAEGSRITVTLVGIDPQTHAVQVRPVAG